MEDFQEQEYEFLRRLEEERFDRRKLLKRGLAAGAGLTILSMPAGALAARRQALADPPLRGGALSLKEWVAQAKKEGKLNTIALPPDWSNMNDLTTTAVGYVKGPGLDPEDEAALDAFIAGLGDGSIQLWTGPLNNQDGTPWLAEGETATPQQIWYTKQLLEGIEGASEAS